MEALPALEGGQLQWKPVRHALGIDAFGISAYHGASEGDLVVEEHADPHQELYLVLRGSARFTAAGEEFVAQAGTLVLLEPKEQRVAYAAEPDTVIVAVGAESKRFEPSQWEFGFRGWGLASLGRYDEARQAIEDGLRQYPDSSRLLYDFACVEALAGNSDRAIALLQRSIELEPRNAEHARDDSDFDALRGRPEFESAIAGKADADGTGP